MLARAFAAGVPAAWVSGDEIYGDDGAFRRWLEAGNHPYVLAVSVQPSALACRHARAGGPAHRGLAAGGVGSAVGGDGEPGRAAVRLGLRPVARRERPGDGPLAAGAALAQRPDRGRLLPRLRASGHARGDDGPRRRDALGDRGQLRGRQRRGGPRPLRGAQVDGLVSPRHPRPAGPCLPGSHPAPRQRRAKRGRCRPDPAHRAGSPPPAADAHRATRTPSASASPGPPFGAGTRRSPGAATPRAGRASSPTRTGTLTVQVLGDPAVPT